MKTTFRPQRIDLMLILTVLLSPLNSHAQARSTSPTAGSSSRIIIQRMDSLQAAYERQIEEMKKGQLRQDVEQAKEHIQRANVIIDWSAMMFTLLAILLVVAGAVGIREFAQLRRMEDRIQASEQRMLETEKKMATSLKNLNEEIEGIQKYKQEIIEDTRKFVKINYFLNEAIRFFQSGNYLRSREFVNRVLELNTVHVEAHYLLGMNLVHEQQHEDADEIFNRLLHITTENSGNSIPFNGASLGYYGLAINCSQQNPQKALDYSDKALEANPKFFKALNFKAKIYIEQQKLDEAIEILKNSIRIEKDPETSFLIGALYYAKNDFENAKKYLKQCIFLANQYIDKVSSLNWALFHIGASEALLGNPVESEKLIKKALNYNSAKPFRVESKQQLKFLLKYVAEQDKRKIEALILCLDHDI